VQEEAIVLRRRATQRLVHLAVVLLPQLDLRGPELHLRAADLELKVVVCCCRGRCRRRRCCCRRAKGQRQPGRFERPLVRLQGRAMALLLLLLQTVAVEGGAAWGRHRWLLLLLGAR
jgi:hypothetical protein